MRRSALALMLFALPASATPPRVVTPVAGHSLTVDALRIDVVDVQATRWARPHGASVLHYAIVRASEHGTTRTLTLSFDANRLDVFGSHALRLLEQPLRLSVEDAPRVRCDEPSAASVARGRVVALGWSTSPVPSSSVLVRGATWEVLFPLAADLDAEVEVDARTCSVTGATQRGGF